MYKVQNSKEKLHYVVKIIVAQMKIPRIFFSPAILYKAVVSIQSLGFFKYKIYALAHLNFEPKNVLRIRMNSHLRTFPTEDFSNFLTYEMVLQF